MTRSSAKRTKAFLGLRETEALLMQADRAGGWQDCVDRCSTPSNPGRGQVAGHCGQLHAAPLLPDV